MQFTVKDRDLLVRLTAFLQVEYVTFLIGMHGAGCGWVINVIHTSLICIQHCVPQDMHTYLEIIFSF